MPPKSRLDLTLVNRGLADSRAKSQALIMARRVSLNGQIADKPGTEVKDDDRITVAEPEHPWVGRGGVKLAHALTHFAIDVREKVCVDLGASTGGFTHVLLTCGATRVYAVDVGYGQLDATLRNDPRVIVREKVNARYLEATDFAEPVEFISADLSFISLRLVLPAISRIVSEKTDVIVLIKPQFEVGKGEVGKGGIVRDETKRQSAVEAVIATAVELGFLLRGSTESPIRGAEGNVEYLVHFSRGHD